MHDVLIKANTMETYRKDDYGNLEKTVLKGNVIRKATNVSFVTPKEKKVAKSNTKENTSR